MIELLHQYPSWFKGVVALWFLATALLAGGFVLLRPVSSHSASTAEEVAPPIQAASVTELAVPITPPAHQASPSSRQISASPAEYAQRLRAHSDRFLEKQEFVELHQNAIVEWTGVVDRVSQHAVSKILSLTLASKDVSPEMQVYVWLPESLRTKAFSLQKGDIVRVKGKLNLSMPSMPDIEASELHVVKPRGG